MQDTLLNYIISWDEMKHKLERPFAKRDISFRKGPGGTWLAYFDARAAMRRLDDVCGPFWQCRYMDGGGGLLICELSIKWDGEWITRSDGAGDTKIEAEKGRASDAFKRACVRFGIGRYLYSLGSNMQSYEQLPGWATPEGYDELMAKRAEELK